MSMLLCMYVYVYVYVYVRMCVCVCVFMLERLGVDATPSRRLATCPNGRPKRERNYSQRLDRKGSYLLYIYHTHVMN